MNRETVSSLFALFSGASADEYMPLISAAVAETEAALREGADKTDIRLCYLAAGLANLRYTTILWAKAKPEATYAGNIARSVSGAPEVMEAFTDEAFDPLDLSYFFGPEATAVPANPVLYPDLSVIERSTMEHDWGAQTEKLITMWSSVKGDNASGFTYVILGAVVIAAAAAALLMRSGKKRRRKKRRR